MMHKPTRNYSHILAAAASVAIMVLLIAAAIRAQMTSADRPARQGTAVFPPSATSALAQAQHPLASWTDTAWRLPVGRSQTKRPGARQLNGDLPLFLPAATYDSGGIICSGQGLPYRWIAVADVNGDGKPDVVVTNCGSGTVGVLLGNGDGTFQAAVTYPSGGEAPQAIAIADVNGDGKPDILVANNGSGTVGVLLGNGDGTFQTAVTYDSGGPPADLAVADVNRDGNPDLVVATCGTGGCFDPGGVLAVLLGNGDGTFRAPLTFSAGIPTSVAVADVNGDGNPDLLVANWDNPGTVAVLLGNGDGTFKSAVSYGSSGIESTSIAVADVNGDNKLDVLVANWCASDINCEDGSVGVLLGNGDGTFQAAIGYDSGGNPATAVAVADVNGDGKPDLVLANWNDGTVGILLGNGDGTFQSVFTYGSGGVMPEAIVIADLNGDGLPDLVIGNVQLYLEGPLEGIVGVLLNDSGPHSPTTTTLVSSLNPAPMRTPVTYTATVTSQGGGANGSVTFQDGGSTIAIVPLANNQAACTTTYTKVGYHKITATYSGDVHNLGSTSATLMENIKGVASHTVLTTSGSPSIVGELVTFTATVTSKYGAIPDGELVTFYDLTTVIGTGTTASGAAPFTSSSLTAKAHTIKATYAGDATFEASSGTIKQVVEKYTTTTALGSSSNPSQYLQAVTFTATVTSAGPTPTGKVKFKDGTTVIGTVTVSGGVAAFTKKNLDPGSHQITAWYLGDANSAESTSAVLDQVVQ
jgi:hypothetical protein